VTQEVVLIEERVEARPLIGANKTHNQALSTLNEPRSHPTACSTPASIASVSQRTTWSAGYRNDFDLALSLNHLPSGRFGANAAWLALNVMSHKLSRWTVRIGGLDVVAASAAAP